MSLFKGFCLSFLLVILFTLCSFAQTNELNDLPKVVPPSPELASIANAAAVKTSLHTGAASVNIPLYDLKVGTIRISIALNYFSNGTKVNEVPGRVGIGWNLITGGSISRIIHDEDDLDPNRDWVNPPDFTPYNENFELYTYMNLANLADKDTEHDEYAYSVNGMSGKFFIDDGGIPRTFEHSNIKIEKIGSYFLLTTAEGIKYYFGTNSQNEKTRGSLTNGTDRWNKFSQTGWFLTQIISPEKDTIFFEYEPIYIKTLQGPSQSVALRKIGNGANALNPECEVYCTPHFYAPVMNRVDYDTKYLSIIRTSDEQSIYFSYDSRGDLGLDNRLVNINSQHKRYEFEYTDYNISGDWNQRFYLKKIKHIPSINIENTNPLVPVVHEFEYYDPSGLPSQFSYGQDYFGYANGINSNSNFFPKPFSYAQYERAAEGANRAPNFEKARQGSLQKVIYPTGGSEEFLYESHSLPEYITDTSYTINTTKSGAGINTRGVQIYTHSFSTSNLPFVKISHYTYNNPSGPFPGEANYWLPDNQHEIAVIEIFRISDNQKVFQSRHDHYQSTSAIVALESNTLYQLKLTIYGVSVYSDAYVMDPEINSYWRNNLVCGIRVKQINSYDPVTQKSVKRFYTYSSLFDLTKSSGIGRSITNYQSFAQAGGVCYPGPAMVVEQVMCKDIYQFSSSSLSSSFSFSGSPVAYKHVIESNALDFVNGGIQHEFSTFYNSTIPLPIIGTIMPPAPGDLEPSLNGVEVNSLYFTKRDNNFITVKEIINTYGIDASVDFYQNNYVTRKRWQPIPFENGVFSMEDKLKPLDLGLYNYISVWHHLNSTEIKEYDQNGQNPVIRKTEYQYNNNGHTQPTLTTTWGSKNQKIEQINKYPADFISAPYPAMVNDHILNPLVETIIKKDDNFQSSIIKEYREWEPGLYLPEVIKGKTGIYTQENRVRFYKYDSKGNQLEIGKENDVHVSYIWGYSGRYPIAEVLNAAYNDIFHTSFEDTEGNSDYGDSKTGKKSKLNGFQKSLSGLNNGSYILSYWQKSGSAWNFQTSNITVNSNEYTITLSGQIDEIRFYPSVAQMATHTYDPLIGITSTCDNNNRITYYEYDGLNRLNFVRDQDKNILKRICYNYAGHPEECILNMNPLWLPTGLTRCQPCPANNAYISNVQEHQEKDNNPYSLGYNTYRWISDGVNSSCVPQADWQNTATLPLCQKEQIVDGGEYNTGFLLQEQKDINPCSPSYNQVRWVDAGLNCSLCPIPGNWQSTGVVTCQKDGNGNNTGYQLIEQRDMESCSATYNTIRTVAVHNPTACPVPYVCNSSNCSGNNKKCINGVCETGTLTAVSSVYKYINHQWVWECTYRYCFSDGTQSTYSSISYSSTACPLTCSIDL